MGIFLSGILIGSGAILPGISSGVLCVIFGVYENLINAILGFFKNIKQNSKFLFPIALGLIIGVIAFGNILRYLFLAYPIQLKFLFIGLILGSIPTLFNQAKEKSEFKLYYFIFTFITLFIAIILVLMENKMYIHYNNTDNFFYIILSGFLMSAGIIIPGISSTLILMLLGIYNRYLSSISTLYFPFLFPLLIGVATGSIIFMYITRFLLNKFYPQTFFAIIGFTLGSILVLYPGFTLDLMGFISILSLLLGFILSQLLTNKS